MPIAPRHFQKMRKSYKNSHFLSKMAVWSEWGDSNARPREPKSRALPTALHPDINFQHQNKRYQCFQDGNILWSNKWSKNHFRHSFSNMINQKPSNIKGFIDSKPENSNFMPFGPKPPALPTAPHPEMNMKFCLEVANMWYEPLLQ